MHWGNTTFAYYNEFNKYMTVEERLQKMSLIISLMLELKFLLEKEKKYILELFEK